MSLLTRMAPATLAVAASLALPAGAGADVLVQSDTGSGGGGALTVNGIDEGNPDNLVVFDWDLGDPDHFTFTSPDPDGPGPQSPPDRLIVDPPCALVAGLPGEPVARCPVAGVKLIVGAMHAGDDSFTGSVTSGSELLTGAGFPVPMLVLGQDGDDFLQTAGLKSRADGGPGDDTLIARAGNSTLMGGKGNDRLMAPEGGNDRLYGGYGGDVLEGFAGDDYLRGMAGRDVLRGGSGVDILEARDTVRDKRIDCGSGQGEFGYADRADPLVRRCERAKRWKQGNVPPKLIP